MKEFSPDTLKAWRARLGLGESGMAAFIGVPLQTYAKWENGTRNPDAAPRALLELLERLETDAPALHLERLESAKQAAPAKPATTGAKRGRKPRAKVDPAQPPAELQSPAQPAPAPLPAWMMATA